MKFNFLSKIDFRKKSTIAFIAFWTVMAILALIVLKYGAGNKFGFYIFTQDYRDAVGAGTTNSYNYTHSTEDISDIEIRWQSGKIQIVPTDKDEFSVKETSAKELGHTSRLIIEGEEGVLLIKWDEQTGLKETLRGQYDKDLILEVPAEFNLGSLKITSVYGDIDLSDIEASELNISTTSSDMNLKNVKAYEIDLRADTGEIELSDVMAEDMKLTTTSDHISAEDSVAYDLILDSVSGDISFAGSFEDLKAASTSGALKLSTDVLPQQLRLGSVSGNVELTIPEDSSIPVTMKTVSGEMSTEFEDLAPENFPEKDEEDKDEGEEETFINISTSSGNAQLLKGEKSQKLVEIFPEEEEE